MPTYDYVCRSCGNRFEVFLSMLDESQVQCNICSGEGFRAPVITGAILKNKGSDCSYESTGTTCCGAGKKCGKDSCGR